MLIIALAAALSACSTDFRRSLAGKDREPTAGVASPAYVTSMQAQYLRNPYDRDTAITYARSLSSVGRYKDSVGVLNKLYFNSPGDVEVAIELADTLNKVEYLAQALQVLQSVQGASSNDWRVLKLMGTIYDRMGRHVDAQKLHIAAQRLNPDSASILNNLGLSYALSNNFSLAEATLRRAASLPSADVRVRQNLSLVLALQQKYNEAQSISANDIPANTASNNILFIRQMLQRMSPAKAMANITGVAKTATSQNYDYSAPSQVKTSQNYGDTGPAPMSSSAASENYMVDYPIPTPPVAGTDYESGQPSVIKAPPILSNANGGGSAGALSENGDFLSFTAGVKRDSSATVPGDENVSTKFRIIRKGTSSTEEETKPKSNLRPSYNF